MSVRGRVDSVTLDVPPDHRVLAIEAARHLRDASVAFAERGDQLLARGRRAAHARGGGRGEGFTHHAGRRPLVVGGGAGLGIDGGVLELVLALVLDPGGDGARQVLESDGRGAAAEHLGLGHHLQELPDVERPVVQHERLEGVRLERPSVRHLPEKIGAEAPQVLDPVAQGGQHDRLRAETPEQRLLQVRPLVERHAAGGGDDADVRFHHPRRAERREPSVLQEAQQLRLQLDRHLADLVEKQGPAVGGLDEADLARLRRRVSPLLVAVELALDELPGDRGAVHGDELPGSLRQGVHGTGEHLLADAGLAQEQDLGVGARQAAELGDGERQRR